MLSLKLKTFSFSLILLVILGLPASVFGATAYLDLNQSQVSVGDSILVNLRLDTEGESINAVDGLLLLVAGADKVAIKDYNLAGSALKQWPRTPSFDPIKKEISYVGGTPGGFQQKDALLFQVVLTALKPGRLTFKPGQMAIYLNDGKAKTVSVIARPLSLEIATGSDKTEDAWAKLLSQDKTPPAAFDLNLVSDPTLFNGHYFITFNTLDLQSGISFYEVKEGSLPVRRSGSPYVLQNNNPQEPIMVIAHDKAGNLRTATLNSSNNFSTLLPKVLITLLLILIIMLFYNRRARWKIK
jgi:hypothetical protein